MASLTEDGHKYTQYITKLRDILEKHGITFISKREFQRDAKNVTTVCISKMWTMFKPFREYRNFTGFQNGKKSLY